MIIHRIQFRDLTAEFDKWKLGDADLLYGALLVAKYQYPELQSSATLQEMERMRRNIWLELNSYMTPVEQVKVMESILYNYYRIRGGDVAYNAINEFMIHKVIESKKGNAITNGIVYLAFASMLDLPVRAINIPRQFVLAWFSHQALYQSDFDNTPSAENIKFYIDSNSGVGFAHKDIELYFKRIAVPPVASYFKPLSNIAIIRLLLEQFANCFDDGKYAYKKDELIWLSQRLEE
jgi:regulator of sirC expression with transglutaminase-like and TPR domain